MRFLSEKIRMERFSIFTKKDYIPVRKIIKEISRAVGLNILFSIGEMARRCICLRHRWIYSLI